MKTTKSTLTFLSMLTILSCMFVSAQAQQDIGYDFIKDCSNKNLFKLVRNGDSKGINTLLSNGYDVNQLSKAGNTALFVASIIGDRPVLEALLSHGADPNIRNKAGATALMVAAKYGHHHVVDVLLENGANPLIKSNKGYRASLFAYGYEHYSLYEKLMNAEQKAEKALKKQKKYMSIN